MITKDKDSFLEACGSSLEKIRLMLLKLPTANLWDFPQRNTAVVLIDLINGFVKNGAMSGVRQASVLNSAAKLLSECNKSEIPVIAFSDSHNAKSPEFSAFPAHCLKGSEESEIADEIKNAGNFILIRKNSTNGCMTKDFQEFKIHHPEINNYIVAGVATDICVLQFSLALLSQFHEYNKECRIVVPLNIVETYDTDSHNGDFMNAAALKIMSDSGVTLVKEIILREGGAK